MMPGAQVGLDLGSVSGGRARTRGFTPTMPPWTTDRFVAWWDGSVASSVTADGSGRISSWLDLWGGTYAAQATTSQMPVTSTQNGLGSVLFDGTDDYLSAPGIIPAVNNTDGAGFTIIVVRRSNTTSGNQFSISAAGSGGYFSGLIGQSEYLERTDTASTNTNAATNALSATRYVVTDYYDSNNILVRINQAVAGGSPVVSGSTGAITATVAWIGGDLRSGGVRWWGGDICEIAVWKKALQGTDLTDAESYLRTKWGTG